MPHFRLETNVPVEKIPKDFAAKICAVLASSLGKPVSFCVATVVGGVNISFGGSDAPAAQATLMSIGGLGPAENKKHSKALCEIVEKTLGVPSDRIYIHFLNAATSEVGYRNSTFQEILG
ncbi:macrophage migration inhibitory factor homolog [Dendroctonus ponderosae]|uniref:L-dopachrome isomerase n=1 Tax=Dendroctonus ponderosae TaxID=77166 RepID=A0AAR5PDG8_DENPD|nr:macrophage migration inhibitory factor homolog [Dendroctonus ponderosae]KAH1011490.1 hypothetical protein HUJ04_000848 [Dendroctonus ponderosae]KAH1018614.1 hypothetical protein HUJ05_006346 [Dendroctonus ponderosae]KAH1018615.1 hypothetical protein HUJ05_006346 [Dendroctonus ponderosae]